MITMVTVQKVIQLSQILLCKLKYVKDKLITDLCRNQGINKWQNCKYGNHQLQVCGADYIQREL